MLVFYLWGHKYSHNAMYRNNYIITRECVVQYINNDNYMCHLEKIQAKMQSYLC